MGQRFVGALGFVMMAMASGAVGRAQPAQTPPTVQVATRPNFLFVITDDIGADDLRCYGHPTIQTPGTDRLAANGLVFDNAFLTVSSCTPSRISIMTGRYPHNTGASELHARMPKGQPTIQSVLGEAGYYTVHSGKRGEGDYPDGQFSLVEEGGKPGGNETWVKLLQERPKDKPFFMWLASHDAHRDWQINDRAPVYKPEDVVVPPYMIDGPETRKDLASYYHEVSRVDRVVNDLQDELKKQGIDQNTIIIYCSDNGRPFPRDKTRLYDSGIKTPLIVSWPGHIKAGRTDALASAIDFMPTVIDLAGLNKPDAMQGLSLKPILDDPTASVRDIVFAEHNWHIFAAHERMARTKDWLYIHNDWPHIDNLAGESYKGFPAGKELWDAIDGGKATDVQSRWYRAPRPNEELFDVRADKNQFKDLSLDPQQADVLKRMRGLLEQWTRETADTVQKNPTRTIYIEGQGEKGKLIRGEMAGDSAGADKVNAPGPVRLSATP